MTAFVDEGFFILILKTYNFLKIQLKIIFKLSIRNALLVLWKPVTAHAPTLHLLIQINTYF